MPPKRVERNSRFMPEQDVRYGLMAWPITAAVFMIAILAILVFSSSLMWLVTIFAICAAVSLAMTVWSILSSD